MPAGRMPDASNVVAPGTWHAAGAAPTKDAQGAVGDEAYSGSRWVTPKVATSGSAGCHSDSTSKPRTDCSPALARTKPVPLKMFDWKPLIVWSKRATLI